MSTPARAVLAPTDPELGPVIPIGEVRWRTSANIHGCVRSVRVQPWAGIASLECVVVDETGGVLLVFLGRRKVAGIELGRELFARGMVGQSRGYLAMLNPDIELIAPNLAAEEVAMPLRKLVGRMTKSVEELDREQLAAFCDDLEGVTHLDQLPLRVPSRFGGEITSVRIVPRAGAPALEVSISDGRGSVVAVFLGRRKIAAMRPGRRIVAEGVPVARGPERLVYNPWYRFLAA